MRWRSPVTTRAATNPCPRAKAQSRPSHLLTDQPATAVSPDGRYLAFYGPQGQLCIGPTSGGPSATLRWQMPGQPVAANERVATPWSPDGARLLLLRSAGSSDGEPTSDV